MQEPEANAADSIAPDVPFSDLVRRASNRYVRASITARKFAQGKMRHDPLYRTVLLSHLLPSGGVLVDVGCGQGLMLALLAEAAADVGRGTWGGTAVPPVFERLMGIETRPRIAAMARQALGQDATILAADARNGTPESCRAVLLFDVLHMMPAEDQETLVRGMAGALEPGGVMLVREADAGAGWRYHAVWFGNRLKAILCGRPRQVLCFRTAAAWTRLFEEVGFEVHLRAAGEGTPFGNVLFVLTRRQAASV
jgi:SAM-dependent methyltransferase